MSWILAEIIVTKWYLTLDWVGGVSWKLSGSRSGHADRCLFATLYFPRGKRFFFFPHWNLNFVRYKVEPYILAPSPWIVIRSFYFVFVISCDKNFSQPCFLTHLDLHVFRPVSRLSYIFRNNGKQSSLYQVVTYDEWKDDPHRIGVF